MVYELGIEKIIMLTNCIEEGKVTYHNHDNNEKYNNDDKNYN